MKFTLLWIKIFYLLFSLFFYKAAIADEFKEKAFDCVIQPNATIKLGSAEEGILKELLVKRGDQVKKGDLLVKLDSEIEKLTAKLAQLRANTDVDIRLARAQKDFRKRETRRMLSLSKKKVVSDMDLDKAKVEERLANLAVESARTEHKSMQIEYKRANERLDRRFVLSPVNAVIVDVEMSEGEYVHEQAHLMTLAVVDPLYVEVFVPVSYYRKIKIGMFADVIPEDPIGGLYNAKVEIVDQVFDPASRTFGVRLLIPNSEYQLPAGLRCKVKFNNELDDSLINTEIDLSTNE